MSTESIWETYAEKTSYPELVGDHTVDVAIIGGGMTGITTAQLLTQRGLKVAVVESLRIGVSSTGHSTGNLYETLGKELKKVREKYSPETVKQVLASRRGAVNLVEKNIQDFGIDCDFRRVPWHYYSAIPEADSKIEDEMKIAAEAGIPLESTAAPEALKSRKAVKLGSQAQFNPLRYLQGLCQNLHQRSCQIFENSKVTEVVTEDDLCLVKTEKGTLTAQYVVHATHTPKGVMPHHTLLGPYREYGIACKIRHPSIGPGIYFGHYDKEEIISTRTYEKDGELYLIVVGEPHKVGQGDTDKHMKRLEDFARKFFDVTEFTHRWGGQHYRPADELPYIGKKGPSSRTFIATGFSTHGLVFGTMAAQLISDQICGVENPYTDLYSASRFTPLKSAPSFIKENANVVSEMVKDFLKNDKSSFSKVAPGEGQVLQHEGHKLAVYRDETQGFKVCSAICPHMGCVVHWNNDERSWDCPCHGSRFDTSGEVLEGPALQALARAELVDNEMPLRNPVNSIQENFNTGLTS